MRRSARLASLILAIAVSLPAWADKASDAYKQGTAAEARQDYVLAYKDYKQAYDLKPSDVRYRSAFTRMRFYASSQMVHRAQLLRDQGKLQDALNIFQEAADIDPSNFVAAQEVRRTKVMIESKGSGGGEASTAQPGENPLSQLAQTAEGPVELHPISSAPITLHMTEDAKLVYTTIGKLAGLNVLFDPDYTSRRITIDLNGVTLYQALEILALSSKTFYRPVTPNTIFVAADTPAKRKELEQNVVKTFYLGNVSSPNDLQDAVNTVRQILDVSRIQQVLSQNAIVVRGTPDQIAMAEKLLSDIDKAKPEVVVEVAVMQVSRTREKTLGINPPTNASVQLQPLNATTTSNTTTNTNTGSSTTSTSNGLTINDLANLKAGNFLVTLPAASFAALWSDNNTKIIQDPQIRALDNQKATLKIGDRVPVATGSFQPGIGGVGINPLVNTQFQYIDVGVNVDITPRIHADREVTLKLVLEISSVTGQSNIGGISQPIIGQRRLEQEIRLREGEVNIMGGILEDSEVHSLTGYPLLSKIPILKYLFSQDDKTRTQNEIVFALIPHIVRLQDRTALNDRAVDVGTANGIDLRRPVPAAQVTPAAAPVQQQMQVQPPQGGVPVNPNPPATAQPVPGETTPPQPQASMQAGNALLSLEPATITQPLNSTFMVNVSLSGAQNVYSVPAQIAYDPKVLQLVNVSSGGFLSQDGQPVALVHREDTDSGTLQVTATRPPGAGGVSGQGPVFTLTFMAKAAGQSAIAVKQAGARDPGMQPIPVAGAQAMVTVK